MNRAMKKMQSMFSVIGGVVLALIGILALVWGVIFDGFITIEALSDYGTGIFFLVVGKVGMQLSYFYDYKVLICSALRRGAPIPIASIKKIRKAELFGVYAIMLEEKTIHITMPFQRKTILAFAKHVSEVNPSCQIDL